MEQKESGLNINVPTAIVIAGLFIAGAIYFSNSPKSGPANQGGLPNTAQGGAQAGEIVIAPITEQDHFYGNPESSAVMVEYSDTECPFCKSFHPTAKKIVDNSKGKVAWVYRHFPLDQLHSKARKEAEATECVAELGGNDKFWEYIGSIFAITPSNDGLNLAELPNLAVKAGIDKAKFEACLASGKYKDKVEANFQDGVKVGVTGTPTTVLINRAGKKILLVGARSEESILAEIDKLLK